MNNLVLCLPLQSNVYTVLFFHIIKPFQQPSHHSMELALFRLLPQFHFSFSSYSLWPHFHNTNLPLFLLQSPKLLLPNKLICFIILIWLLTLNKSQLLEFLKTHSQNNFSLSSHLGSLILSNGFRYPGLTLFFFFF